MPLLRTAEGSFLLAQADPHAAAPADAAHSTSDTHAGTAADGHGGGHGAFPPFAPEFFLAQLIWLAITFGALYYILSKHALPRIGGILEERQGRIDADLGEAERLRSQSEAAIHTYEEALASARSRAQTLAGETRDQIAREAETSRKALEAELSEKLAQAEAQIASTKTAAMSNVRGIASDAAAEIVQHLTGLAPAANEVEHAVDAALARRPAA